MNKRTVDMLLPQAVAELRTAGIADDNGVIAKTFRGQISTFGAAVTNGSLLSAIVFFSEQNNASVERQNLMKAIKALIPEARQKNTLFDYVKDLGKGQEKKAKEQVLNAAIALKLAMNLYKLK